MEQRIASKNNGYLLVEAMVAMGVLTTSVLGIFVLMSQSIKITRIINDQYVGTYLSAEGIELVKNLLDTNTPAFSGGAWNAGGFSTSGCYEIDINTEVLPSEGCSQTPLRLLGSVYAYGLGDISGFSRSIQLTPLMDSTNTTQEGVRVVSTVTWAGGDSTVVLEDKFYNWH